jgi:D-alanyl-D-alanine carboxypeptidase/D-alanyl-D-alanine-endopeptidase (penicillin-binding protein 4)
LRDIVENTNRLSNNHYAEHLYRYLGSRKTSSDVTAGAEVINEFWKSKGVDTDGLIQYDGSGLAPVNAITPEFLVNLLTWEYTQAKYGKVFYASLPVAGQTGTVKSLLRGTRLAGRVRCKSGSISRTQCYAGYVEWQGETYAFAVMVNNFRGSRERVKRAIGSLLLSLTDETVGEVEQEMNLHDDAPLESSDTNTEPSAE